MNVNCSGVGYVIREGDTLYKISRRFRIPLPLLLRANLNVNVYNLIPGQKICIPVHEIDDDMDCFPPGGLVPPPEGVIPPGGTMPPMSVLPPSGMMPPGMLPPGGMIPPSGMIPQDGRPPMNETRPRQQYEDNLMFTNEINSTRKHIVGENESLESVIDMYNVSMEELFKYNNRNGIILKEDQIINMP